MSVSPRDDNFYDLNFSLRSEDNFELKRFIPFTFTIFANKYLGAVKIFCNERLGMCELIKGKDYLFIFRGNYDTFLSPDDYFYFDNMPHQFYINSMVKISVPIDEKNRYYTLRCSSISDTIRFNVIKERF